MSSVCDKSFFGLLLKSDYVTNNHDFSIRRRILTVDIRNFDIV